MLDVIVIGAGPAGALSVVAVGWVANTAGLRLATAGVETDHRGFVRVDDYLR
jgi:pyruvate/2-oxoglutarate dehydrogenase complex dihydrolipoamide dehydrogenase (E3) component